MSWWVSGYFAAYATFTLWSLSQDFRDRTDPLWFLAAEVGSDVLLVVSALAYWLPPLHAVLAPFLFLFFAVGASVLIGQIMVAFRRQVLFDKELPLQGKLFVGVSGTALGVIVSAPLLFWGFNSAILGTHVGT